MSLCYCIWAVPVAMLHYVYIMYMAHCKYWINTQTYNAHTHTHTHSLSVALPARGLIELVLEQPLKRKPIEWHSGLRVLLVGVHVPTSCPAIVGPSRSQLANTRLYM